MEVDKRDQKQQHQCVGVQSVGRGFTIAGPMRYCKYRTKRVMLARYLYPRARRLGDLYTVVYRHVW